MELNTNDNIKKKVYCNALVFHKVVVVNFRGELD